MARGFKTGGRKKGVKNLASAEAQKAAKSAGITPLEYMLSVVRDPEARSDRRDRMAQAAAPYVHARIAALDNPVVNVSSNDPEGIQISFVLPDRQGRNDDG
jgi:hypothetical protein